MLKHMHHQMFTLCDRCIDHIDRHGHDQNHHRNDNHNFDNGDSSDNIDNHQNHHCHYHSENIHHQNSDK